MNRRPDEIDSASLPEPMADQHRDWCSYVIHALNQIQSRRPVANESEQAAR